jgi:hypothetical protein
MPGQALAAGLPRAAAAPASGVACRPAAAAPPPPLTQLRPRLRSLLTGHVGGGCALQIMLVQCLATW